MILLLFALLFFVTTLMGLLVLAQPPVYDSTATASTGLPVTWDWTIFVLFTAGLVLLLAFGTSFYRLADLLLKASTSKASTTLGVQK